MLPLLNFFAIWLLIWRSRPFVAVTPNGIMYHWLLRSQSIKWKDILCAPGFEADVAFVESQNGMSFTKFLPNKSDQAEFRQAVNDGVARYNHAPNSESPQHAAADTIKSSITSTERSHTDAG